MRPLPLIAVALLAAGCASSASSAGIDDGPRVRNTTIDIETVGGGTYTVSQTVERNVMTEGLAASPDEAWKALPDVFRELEIPVTMVDSRNRMLGTTENRLARIATERPSRYLDCGSGMAGQYANIYHVFVTLLTQVEPGEGGGTRVLTQLEAAARDPAHSNSAIRCTSRGLLEKQIAEALQARLAAATP